MLTSLCVVCIHYKQEELEGYYQNLGVYGIKYYPPITAYRCKATKKAIIFRRLFCPHYIDIHQKRLKVVSEGMVKLEDIPSEGATIELKDLPQEAELIAIEERTVDKAEGKAGGLVIKYKLRDKRTFKQKYTKLSGHILQLACKKLKITDTKQLQDLWFNYKLTPMRMGHPRMIPIKVAKTQ